MIPKTTNTNITIKTVPTMAFPTGITVEIVGTKLISTVPDLLLQPLVVLMYVECGTDLYCYNR
jgi:hypothetical protein